MNKKEQANIEEAVNVLKNGGIVVYPTETVYGIGCDPFNRIAYERVQHLKGRNNNKQMLLLACSLSQVEHFTGRLADIPRRLAHEFWPGPLTMVIKPRNEMPVYLYGDSGGVAFRITSHPIAAALSRNFGCPITSTSANMTGKPTVGTYEEALNMFGKDVSIVIKNHIPLNGTPSTVIDLTSGKPLLIREGNISFQHILGVL
ncbi:MAG: threonylcarbamoyl-AMP synthase [Candidatus Latescibacteria bacterium]|jgi:L-threonylcarbamoyladenylate synthase|nr:threonylcarbamoyl-AMP synthase [Candidatus Latescibacterota bacterium]